MVAATISSLGLHLCSSKAWRVARQRSCDRSPIANIAGLRTERIVVSSLGNTLYLVQYGDAHKFEGCNQKDPQPLPLQCFAQGGAPSLAPLRSLLADGGIENPRNFRSWPPSIGGVTTLRPGTGRSHGDGPLNVRAQPEPAGAGPSNQTRYSCSGSPAPPG